MGLLKLENVAKHFPPNWTLSIESLDVWPGKIYAVYGPNGSGKTTLLNIMALLLRPDKGDLSFKGSEISFSNGSLHKYRKNISLVMQKGLLFKGTVHENLKHGFRYRRIPESKMRSIIDDVARPLGLHDFLDRDVSTLSGGERQRVMLMRALVLDVDLLLLDEVMAGVDIGYKDVVEELVRNYAKKKGKAVVMTTHDLFQAQYLADEVIYMNAGEITL